MPERSTGTNIALRIEAILNTFKLKKEQIVGATTDGGANIVLAMNIVFGAGINTKCILHYFHNMVKRLIDLFVTLKEAFALLFLFITHGRLSNLTIEAFR